MPVVKTPVAILDILDAEQKVSGHEIEYHYSFSEETPEEVGLGVMFQPKVQREEATPEQVAALRGTSEQTLTARIQEVAQANAELQEQAKSAIKENVAAQALADQAERSRDAALSLLSDMKAQLRTLGAE